MTRPPVEALTRHVAYAAGSFEQRLLGRVPKSVTVSAVGDSMTVCMHESLSPVERRLAVDPQGARRVRALHEDLFADAVDSLLGEIRRRTGVALCGALIHVDLTTGSILKTFTTGPSVELFLFGGGVPALGPTVDAHVRVQRDPELVESVPASPSGRTPAQEFTDRTWRPASEPSARDFIRRDPRPMTRMNDVGAHQEESRERGDRPA